MLRDSEERQKGKGRQIRGSSHHMFEGTPGPPGQRLFERLSLAGCMLFASLLLAPLHGFVHVDGRVIGR